MGQVIVALGVVALVGVVMMVQFPVPASSAVAEIDSDVPGVQMLPVDVDERGDVTVVWDLPPIRPNASVMGNLTSLPPPQPPFFSLPRATPPTNHPVCLGKFTVLIVYSHTSSNPVCEMFSEIAYSIAHGLQALGYDADVICCALYFRHCEGDRNQYDVKGRQVILLGAGALAPEQVLEEEDDRPRVQGERRPRNLPARDVPPPKPISDGWLPADLILYQFDHISYNQNSGFDAVVFGDYVGMLRHVRVWDYSWYNMRNLALDHGIRAAFCPLGYDRVHTSFLLDRVTLEPRVPPPNGEDIDVLFFGALSPHRERLFRRLHDGTGIHVSLPGAALWGEELARVLFRAKIVLIPAAWGDPGEYKLSRLATVLGNARFALVEDVSLDADSGYFRPGFGGTSESTVADDVLHWLSHPEERRRVAKEGYRLFTARPSALMLAPCVQELRVTFGCDPAGVAASVPRSGG